MSSTIKTLTSPYLLCTTSMISFISARFIIYRVKRHGPVSFAPTLTKYNSRFYAFASSILFLAILASFWSEIVDTPNPSLKSAICSPSTTDFDKTLRNLYHFSKFYEYIDIFNVLACGGAVSAHFGIHHFTDFLHECLTRLRTPYLTYARVLKHPSGWKIFASLNTFHHGLMYAYFGGAAVFSDIIVWTGCLQLAVGIGVELYAISKNRGGGKGDCGVIDALWANVLAMVLLSTYAVLFSGDLRARGKTAAGGHEKQE